MTTIKTLSARLIGDYSLIITADLIKVQGNFATIIFENQTKRCKIYTSFDGSKYIFPDGKYSMAPTFTI